MNSFQKLAYELNRSAQLQKTAKESEGMDPTTLAVLTGLTYPVGGGLIMPIADAATAPEGRGLSRFGHAFGGGILGAMGGGLAAGTLGVRTIPGVLAAGALGTGLGTYYGAKASREND